MMVTLGLPLGLPLGNFSGNELSRSKQGYQRAASDAVFWFENYFLFISVKIR